MGHSLVLQGLDKSGNTWYYSTPVSDSGAAIIKLADVKAMGITNIDDLANCKMWTERQNPNDNFIYASTPKDFDQALLRKPTPAAVFEAGDMTLFNVTTSMEYSLNGGGSWIPVPANGTITIANPAGVGIFHGIQVIDRGDNKPYDDSYIQTINLTLAVAPTVTYDINEQANIIATRPAEPPTEEEPGHGYLTFEDYSLLEFFPVGTDEDFTAVPNPGGNPLELPAGTYEFRVKGHGTVLASPSEYVYLTYNLLIQLPTTQAEYDAVTSRLYNVTNNMQYSLLSDGSWNGISATTTDPVSEKEYIVLDPEDLIAGPTGIIVIETGNHLYNTRDSAFQNIPLEQAAEPVITKTDQSTIGGGGTIAGNSTTAMEYRLSTDSTWITVEPDDGSITITGLAPGTYQVRTKAHGYYSLSNYIPHDPDRSAHLASEFVEITILSYSAKPESAPQGSLNPATAKLKVEDLNVTHDYYYLSLDGTYPGDMDWKLIKDEVTDLETDLGTDTLTSASVVYLLRKGDGTYTIDSSVQEIHMDEPAAPGVAANPVLHAGATGSLLNVDDSMEYRLKNTSEPQQWSSLEGLGGTTELTGLAAGTYEVRYRAKDQFFSDNAQIAGAIAEVTIAVGGITVAFDLDYVDAPAIGDQHYWPYTEVPGDPPTQERTEFANLPVPERAGYVFNGWHWTYNDEDFLIVDGQSLPEQWEVPSTYTLHAKWLRTLTISKVVSGAFADITRKFTFTASFKDEDGNSSTFSSEDIECTGAIVENSGATAPPSGTLTADASGTVSFPLSHGQVMILTVPDSVASVAIAETDAPTDYATTFSIDGEPPVSARYTQSQTMNDSMTVAFTNTRTGVVPTGISTGGSAWIVLVSALLMLAGYTCCLIVARKRAKVR